MKHLFFYVILSSTIISCIKDKSATPESPKVVIETSKPPPAPEVDSVPVPPATPVKVEVKKTTPLPQKKKKKVVKKKDDFESLIFNTRLCINPGKENWVLFKNGTYLIFPNNTAEKDAIRAAKKILSAHNGNIVFIEKSNFAKGWIASTPNGIYNYIDKGTFGIGIPKSTKIEAKGIENIAADKKGLEIIHVNSPK